MARMATVNTGRLDRGLHPGRPWESAGSRGRSCTLFSSKPLLDDCAFQGGLLCYK